MDLISNFEFYWGKYSVDISPLFRVLSLWPVRLGRGAFWLIQTETRRQRASNRGPRTSSRHHEGILTVRWWGNQGGQKPKGGRRERAGKASPDTDALEDGPEQVDGRPFSGVQARVEKVSHLFLFFFFSASAAEGERKSAYKRVAWWGEKKRPIVEWGKWYVENI